MESDARVCPFCGERPGVGTFCDACGRNLSALEQLPTRAEWELEPPPSPTAASGTLAARCAAATESFLAAMRAAGNPGATKAPFAGGSGLRLTRRPHAWVLRPVGRENADPMHYEYEPGLLLTTEGRFHRLESEVRGWGQARFPRYVDTAAPDPIDMPVEERLIEELAGVLRDNDVSARPRLTTAPGRAEQEPGPEG